jgi:CheY-like chemotaxis protein
VRAESDGRDAGTRFVMQLARGHLAFPARDPRKPASAATASVTTDVPRLDGVRVLIVDDDRESCEMMLEALRGHGASLRAAMSASDAVDALSKFKPDLVLSDIAMPGLDGYAVLRHVRALETAIGRHVPIAAVTAYAHGEDRERASLQASMNTWPNQLIPQHSPRRLRPSRPLPTGNEAGAPHFAQTPATDIRVP